MCIRDRYGYEWPQVSDLRVLIMASVASIRVKKLLIKLTYSCLKKYVKQAENPDMQNFRIEKACLRLYATFYFIWVIVYGFKVNVEI